ncbi:MAG: hypothetical protein EOM20_12070 [Spartobacteria bacterium]|nr:hypothetical protein [Spartobacteria bacterium]
MYISNASVFSWAESVAHRHILSSGVYHYLQEERMGVACASKNEAGCSMRRILISYMGHHTGHHSAARALEYAFKQVNPSIETMCVDLLAYTHPRWSSIIQKTYMSTIRRTPEVWETLYDSPIVEYMTRRVRRLVQRGNSRPMLQLMEDFKPHAAVCTQAHPFAVLNSYIQKQRSPLPLWGVITDFVPHRFWVVNGAARYIVPTESSANRLVWLGVQKDHIYELGIPVNPDVVERLDLKVSRNGNGDRRILVMGGSQGLGIRYSAVRQLDKSDADFTIDVVCGMNKTLRKTLIRKRHMFRHPIRVRGYVQDAMALMHRASLLVSKPGGLTSAEAMITGLPMLIMRPLPGQERGNTDVLVNSGAAIHIRKETELGPIVSQLLTRPGLLNRMMNKAHMMAKPSAARLIVHQVLEDLG